MISVGKRRRVDLGLPVHVTAVRVNNKRFRKDGVWGWRRRLGTASSENARAAAGSIDELGLSSRGFVRQ